MSVVVDSCGWLEYFTDGPLADKYLPYIEKNEELLVPTIVLYEVYRKIMNQGREESALLAVARMKQAGIVDLTEGIALSAAGLGLKYSLPLADSVVYASATASGAQLITGDMHFRGLPGVKLLENV